MSYAVNFDPSQIASLAQQQHGTASQDSSLFSTAMQFLNSGKAQDNEDLDEDGIIDAHQKAYSSSHDTSNMGSSSLGAAAAMEALKKFTSGGAQPQQQSTGSGGGMQAKLIAMAMAEASKLFDKNGGASGGNKQSVVSVSQHLTLTLIEPLILTYLFESVHPGMSSTRPDKP